MCEQKEVPIYLFSLSSHPDAISIPSLDIRFFHPDIDFSNTDTLILTSKQAVEALKQYDSNTFLHIPALCISKATAAAYEAIGGKVLQTASGYGADIAQLITHYPKQRRYLYLRAKTVASDFATRCKKEGYYIAQAVVYETVCSGQIANTTIPNTAVLIFTESKSWGIK